ncbi:heparan-alpha-glucosaminide N-acetyltransferase domain-containing protein [Paeniglutamicibacter sp. MACA_103]|uniref:heparan-alpha-glucosaminide N-acetyltransferase domain-containing protein n=1 Tax=Paeniglutamicibacter sp. MACA_103 TaxID=3377337 RepID=UPI0038954187
MTQFSSRGTRHRAPGTGGSGPRTRIAGVDAARGLALLGMVAVHIMPLRMLDADGSPAATWAAAIFSGRASALFVVLAGVGLALLSGGSGSIGAPKLAGVRRSVAVRALLVFVLGLGLGMLDTNVAVILVHYAVLFLCAIPFLGMRARTLGIWAAGWLALSPFALYLAAPWAMELLDPHRLGASPLPEDLFTPAVFLADLLLTGYYPLLAWFGFILAGLCVGRLGLSRPPVALAIGAAGTALAVGSKALSAWLLEQPGAFASLARAANLGAEELAVSLVTGQRLGNAADSGWFLAISAPHSGAPLDLLHVVGCALAVLGAAQLVCLALAALLGQVGEMLLWPLTGAGAATLTLYATHLVALDLFSDVSAPLPRTGLFIIYAVGCLLAGLLFKFLGRRGPLEALVHSVSTTLGRSK